MRRPTPHPPPRGSSPHRHRLPAAWPPPPPPPQPRALQQGEVHELATWEVIVYGMLLAVILWLLKEIFLSARAPPPATRPTYQPRPKPIPRNFTAQELRKYDGSSQDTPIYVCIKGRIYDVSSRPQFYGPGGPYHLFAGRDASRALALGSLEEKDMDNTSLEGLSWSELDALNDWEQSFEMKYDLVGYLVSDEQAQDHATTSSSSSSSSSSSVPTNTQQLQEGETEEEQGALRQRQPH
ncbi:Membrane steroid-binding protein 2 [Balamuthia mandrillaris]